MALELIISIGALAIVFTGILMGWKYGGASVLRYALVTLFATLVALRFWHIPFPLIVRFSLPPGFSAAAILLALFVLGGGLAAAVVNLKVAGFQNVFSNVVDNIVGAIMGLFTASLISGVLLIAAGFVIPNLGHTYDASQLLTRLDKWPTTLYHALEEKVAGIPDVSPAHTPLPIWQGGADDGKVIWQ